VDVKKKLILFSISFVLCTLIGAAFDALVSIVEHGHPAVDWWDSIIQGLIYALVFTLAFPWMMAYTKTLR
jgi:hypothetical protein